MIKKNFPSQCQSEMVYVKISVVGNVRERGRQNLADFDSKTDKPLSMRNEKKSHFHATFCTFVHLYIESNNF